MWHPSARATLAPIGILMPDLQTILGGRFADGPGPLYRRLAQAIADAAERGDLEAGAPLPAERQLCRPARRQPHDCRRGLRRAAGARRDRAPARLGHAARAARRRRAARRTCPLGRIGRNAVIRTLIEGVGDALDLTAAALPMNPVMDAELLAKAAADLADPAPGARLPPPRARRPARGAGPAHQRLGPCRAGPSRCW